MVKNDDVAMMMDLNTRIQCFGNSLFIEAVDEIEAVLIEHDCSCVAVSFNGGKDCTVLLYLVVAAISRLSSQTCKNLHTIYFKLRDEFPQVKNFIHDITESLGFHLEVSHESIRVGLWSLVERKSELKAVLMGQRRTDPRCEGLHIREKCDVGWPDLIRVNPILDWSYGDVWDFLRQFNLRYCSLYDHGYTSLGSQSKTSPNPLLNFNGSFMPAYMLKDQASERWGRSSPAPQAKLRTAALLIVGDEILNGSQQDLNTPFLCSSLHDIGVTVKKVSIVRDSIEQIAREAPLLAADHDVVISCGGIGPTPDDVTMQGMSEGFHVELQTHDRLVCAIKSAADEDTQSQYMVMADVPEGSHLHFVDGEIFPIVSFRNLFILPGVPRLVQQKFSALQPLLKSSPFVSTTIALLVGEGAISVILQDLSDKFPHVSIGSYLQDSSATNPVQTKVIFEAKDREAVSSAVKFFLAHIDEQEVDSISDEPFSIG